MSDTELILKIINAVKQRGCLWNVNSPEYGKRDKLEKAWQEVADDVGKPDVFCREKWRNVRTGFLRSIQYNAARNENNSDSLEDWPTPKRKRFYLYDDIKFILQSTEAIGQTKKRRKLSRGTKSRASNDEPTSIIDYGGGDTNTTLQSIQPIQTFAANDETKNFSNSKNNEVAQNSSSTVYPELLTELKLAANSSKTMITRQSSATAASSMMGSNHQQAVPLRIDETKDEPNLHSTPILGGGASVMTKCENNSMTGESFNMNATSRKDHDDRDEQQLVAFFRGNIDDILALPRYKQRLFKRRMLELIDDLHASDNGMGNNHYS